MPTQSCPFAVEEAQPTAPAGHLLCQEGAAMSKRSSTRVHHAPGGASSLSLSHDETAKVDNSEKISSNCFASKSDPNGPNSITGRPMTKVHAPPGGKGSFSIMESAALGSMHCDDGEAGKKQSKKEFCIAPLNSQGVTAECSCSLPALEPVAGVPPGGHCTDQSSLSSNSYANNSNQNGGNLITNRRITKVQAPPGGRSNITLG
ncbi:hypothetical protein FOL47_006250 [Perkinsus chesapeaki]|uniref:Uncharacterized protein n=1 Tax=Perkinsus chesapeaki TaxID=330153 RepID=A0A7J6LTU8_PERCH|nr:hypothetical protein FOL47_006250 [Perkinsus chesapeaki]